MSKNVTKQTKAFLRGFPHKELTVILTALRAVAATRPFCFLTVEVDDLNEEKYVTLLSSPIPVSCQSLEDYRKRGREREEQKIKIKYFAACMFIEAAHVKEFS